VKKSSASGWQLYLRKSWTFALAVLATVAAILSNVTSIRKNIGEWKEWAWPSPSVTMRSVVVQKPVALYNDGTYRMAVELTGQNTYSADARCSAELLMRGITFDDVWTREKRDCQDTVNDFKTIDLPAGREAMFMAYHFQIPIPYLAPSGKFRINCGEYIPDWVDVAIPPP
jgi:hypothetical protein